MIETSDTFESALPAATVVLVRDGDKGLEVQVDGGEIAHHRWIAPAQALAELLNEETVFRLMPPTYVSMVDVAPYSSGLEALSAIGNREAIIYAPRMVFVATRNRISTSKVPNTERI